MTNEVSVQSKETKKDDSSFSAESNTRILEVSLKGYRKDLVSISIDVEKESKVKPFSSIFKKGEQVTDEDLFY